MTIQDDPFTAAVKMVLPWSVAFIATVLLVVAMGYHQSIQREAIRRNLATYDESGTFVWKERE